MLERFPAISAFFIASVLVISVTYEWAYFSAIGPEWRSLLAPQDYLALVVEWLPGSLIFAMIGLAANLIFTRIEGGKTEQEIAALSPNPKFTSRFRTGADIALGLSLILGMLTSILLGPPHVFKQAAAIIIAVLWFPISRWIFSHERMVQRYPSAVRLLIMCAPSVLLTVYATGARQGFIDLRERSNLYRVVTQDGAEMTVGILRSIERGILARDYTSNQNALVTWDEIKELNQEKPPPSETPSICRFTKIPMCIHENPPTDNVRTSPPKR